MINSSDPKGGPFQDTIVAFSCRDYRIAYKPQSVQSVTQLRFELATS